MKLNVDIHYEDGTYWAQVVEMPGCHAAGDTLDELQESLAEAIGLCMPDYPELFPDLEGTDWQTTIKLPRAVSKMQLEVAA